jgi:hypothetical protein
VTKQQGSPYTLVRKRTHALFAREHEARARDHADLEWLAAGGISVLDRLVTETGAYLDAQGRVTFA